MGHILLVEDEVVIRAELKRLLTRAGHQVSEAGSVAEAQSEFDLDAFDLVLTDLRLPGADGTDLIRLAAPVPVLVMTSYATIRSAVAAMQLGAADYIAKPFDHDELLLLLQRWLETGRLRKRVSALEKDVARVYPVAGIIGESPAMQELLTRIHKVAKTEASVLIRGESGTGKELVARAIHEHSTRSQAPLVAVNCAAIPDNLLESELFGHERGAFTGAQAAHAGLIESASSGTLFLDEIGELPGNAQARLLRVLQEGEVRRVGSTRTRKVDVRLIAATHRDLPAMVRSGAFRQDLYHRLRVFEIFVPKLSERGADIELLSHTFLVDAGRKLGKPGLTLSAEARVALREHDWPGNVRELHNAIERAAILCEDGQITPELLAIEPAGARESNWWREPETGGAQRASPSNPAPQPSAAEDTTSPESASGGDSLEAYFRRFVLEYQDALSETELAKRLGVSRKTLWERRTKLGIPRPRTPSQS